MDAVGKTKQEFLKSDQTDLSSMISIRQVAERLSEFNEVVYILWVSGRFDLIVEVVCDSTKSFQTFLEFNCCGSVGIDQLDITAGIEMLKNQFLLKRQAL